eukprot:CAMPEP_0171958544 /NCGR_PEP_ID=MMETSP0993-20121228/140909_1 /TAXON_ID=483369 /ORGANISM="non described non described, Strain CCMP2098" /LENGTH=64 /DNA_ID=CAMNT_0012605781 /DNA_START=102 /DNA_END=292 /DNA_ORIENTATION=+
MAHIGGDRQRRASCFDAEMRRCGPRGRFCASLEENLRYLALPEKNCDEKRRPANSSHALLHVCT